MHRPLADEIRPKTLAEVVPGYTDVKEDLTFNPNGPKYQN